MVVSIRDSENIFFSKSVTTIISKRMSFTKVEGMNVDDIHGGSPDNYNNMRGLTIFPAKPLLAQILYL